VLAHISDSIINNILALSPLIVYGERGVGKTIFLYQLARSLEKHGLSIYFWTTHSSLRTLRSILRSTQLSDSIMIFVVEDYSISLRLEALSKIFDHIKHSLEQKEISCAIILDDFLPVNILLSAKIDPHYAKFLTTMLFWLSTVSRVEGIFFVGSTIENLRTGCPFKARLMAAYKFNFMRISRISRVRELTHVQMTSERIPVTIEKKPLWKAIISARGFVFIKEHS